MLMIRKENKEKVGREQNRSMIKDEKKILKEKNIKENTKRIEIRRKTEQSIKKTGM